MKIKPVSILMILSVLVILYLFAGHGFLKFYLGGKAEILEAGEHINSLCNANGACPTTLEGWEQANSGAHLFKNEMLYYVDPGEDIKDGGERKQNQTFKLVYRFFMPDDWFEVQGGVGKQVTSGWTGR
ncbi:MAG: hypothetical protein HY911_12380 [Desulfobacterales bacterium]|nr:hypothetical protein [Desulfobacterales bacterium]